MKMVKMLILIISAAVGMSGCTDSDEPMGPGGGPASPGDLSGFYLGHNVSAELANSALDILPGDIVSMAQSGAIIDDIGVGVSLLFEGDLILCCRVDVAAREYAVVGFIEKSGIVTDGQGNSAGDLDPSAKEVVEKILLSLSRGNVIDEVQGDWYEPRVSRVEVGVKSQSAPLLTFSPDFADRYVLSYTYSGWGSPNNAVMYFRDYGLSVCSSLNNGVIGTNDFANPGVYEFDFYSEGGIDVIAGYGIYDVTIEFDLSGGGKWVEVVPVSMASPDLNGDLIVDLNDFSTFGLLFGDGNYYSYIDYDRSGIVDLADFSYFGIRYYASCH